MLAYAYVPGLSNCMYMVNNIIMVLIIMEKRYIFQFQNSIVCIKELLVVSHFYLPGPEIVTC